MLSRRSLRLSLSLLALWVSAFHQTACTVNDADSSADLPSDSASATDGQKLAERIVQHGVGSLLVEGGNIVCVWSKLQAEYVARDLGNGRAPQHVPNPETGSPYYLPVAEDDGILPVLIAYPHPSRQPVAPESMETDSENLTCPMEVEYDSNQGMDSNGDSELASYSTLGSLAAGSVIVGGMLSDGSGKILGRRRSQIATFSGGSESRSGEEHARTSSGGSESSSGEEHARTSIGGSESRSGGEHARTSSGGSESSSGGEHARTYSGGSESSSGGEHARTYSGGSQSSSGGEHARTSSDGSESRSGGEHDVTSDEGSRSGSSKEHGRTSSGSRRRSFGKRLSEASGGSRFRRQRGELLSGSSGRFDRRRGGFLSGRLDRNYGRKRAGVLSGGRGRIPNSQRGGFLSGSLGRSFGRKRGGFSIGSVGRSPGRAYSGGIRASLGSRLGGLLHRNGGAGRMLARAGGRILRGGIGKIFSRRRG